jgi:hypothetical protein
VGGASACASVHVGADVACLCWNQEGCCALRRPTSQIMRTVFSFRPVAFPFTCVAYVDGVDISLHRMEGSMKVL